MAWLTHLFDWAARVRSNARAAYRINFDHFANDLEPPVMLQQLYAQGMSVHEITLFLTLAAFYQKYRNHPVTDRAALCEVCPLFFVRPDEDAISLLAEYCVYLTDENRADRELLTARFSEAVSDAQHTPFLKPIHAEYPEWIARAVDAGSPWLVLLRPDVLRSVSHPRRSDPPSHLFQGDTDLSV